MEIDFSEGKFSADFPSGQEVFQIILEVGWFGFLILLASNGPLSFVANVPTVFKVDVLASSPVVSTLILLPALFLFREMVESSMDMMESD